MVTGDDDVNCLYFSASGAVENGEGHQLPPQAVRGQDYHHHSGEKPIAAGDHPQMRGLATPDTNHSHTSGLFPRNKSLTHEWVVLKLIGARVFMDKHMICQLVLKQLIL